MTVLVTGAAGFIGCHVSRALAVRGDTVLGVDNLNDRYSPALKQARLRELQQLPGFTFSRADVAEPGGLDGSLDGAEIETVVHLAAQTGVRDADPRAQVRDNLLGQVELLEFCRRRSVSHFVHASTSAVYGGNAKLPHDETDRVDDPLSVYAATKRGGRTAVTHLLRPARRPCHLPAVLHDLRAVGTPGHGGMALHRGDPCRATDSNARLRQNAAELHLH